MGQNKVINVIFVIWWAITLYLVATGKNMLAMYAMAVGMLVEEILPLLMHSKCDKK